MCVSINNQFININIYILIYIYIYIIIHFCYIYYIYMSPYSPGLPPCGVANHGPRHAHGMPRQAIRHAMACLMHAIWAAFWQLPLSVNVKLTGQKSETRSEDISALLGNSYSTGKRYIWSNNKITYLVYDIQYIYIKCRLSYIIHYVRYTIIYICIYIYIYKYIHVCRLHS